MPQNPAPSTLFVSKIVAGGGLSVSPESGTGIVTISAAPQAGTATATSGAATLNALAGKITSEALTTTAGSDYTLTLTNSDIAAADLVFASVDLGTATTGEPAITSVTPAAGSVVIKVRNIAASAVFNGTIVISFNVVKA